jgi:methylated-DNA-[protein]-cysteine S-methyltransferase
MEAVREHLTGTADNLRSVPLDTTGVSRADRRVYEPLRRVGKGTRTTYGQLARRLGPPATPRSVCRALARNRVALDVPCHRVVAANGRIGGFSPYGGITTKLHLLAIEQQHAADCHSRATSPSLRFDVGRACRDLRAKGEIMATVMRAHGRCAIQIGASPSVFTAPARDRLSAAACTAAEAIRARMLALVGANAGDHDPRTLLIEELRAVGLSLAKIASLRDLAQQADKGGVPTLAEAHDLDDEEIVERVTRVRGVGRWTAQMLLIFTLGRPDVLPIEDFSVRSGSAPQTVELRSPLRSSSATSVVAGRRTGRSPVGICGASPNRHRVRHA